MAENMFSPQQKAVSDEYRQNYDRIEWEPEDEEDDDAA